MADLTVGQARAVLNDHLRRWDNIPTYGGVEDMRLAEQVRAEIEAAKDALIAAAEAKGRAEERERLKLCTCGKALTPDRISIWWMFDMHVFRRLSSDPREAAQEAKAIARDAGDWGMLCPITLLCGDKEVTRICEGVHSRGGRELERINAEVDLWLETAMANPDVQRILATTEEAQG